MNRVSSPSVSSVVFLIFIICLATLPVIGLQSNIGISSYGTINYSTTARLHVDGKYLKDASGNVVILRGVAYSSSQWWDGDSYDQYQVGYMKNWGCNALRIAVQCYSLESGIMNDSTFLARLDDMIARARDQNMYVILNGFHPAAYCPHGDVRVDCTHYMQTHWGGSDWSDWIALWETWAQRYKDFPNVLYELTSEPMNCPMDVYQSRTRACIDAIRAIDPDCVILVHAVGQTNGWDQSFLFEKSYPINRSNIMYIFHFYSNHTSGNTQQAIRNKLASLYADWMLANGRCVEATEFGGREETFDNYDITWLNNYMTVLDADGYSGYQAWCWYAHSGYSWFNLLSDWNGTPSAYGNVVRNYYLAH